MLSSIFYRSIVTFILSIAIISADAQIHIYAGVDEGSYNKLAQDIKSITNLEVEIIPTGGSAENYDRLINDTSLCLAFLQYDVLLFKKLQNSQETKNIQIIAPLPYEEIHLITYTDTGIKTLADLEGKTVAIGAPTQGTNITARLIKQQTGMSWTDVESDFNDAFVELFIGAVDALFFVGAAPVVKLRAMSPKLKKLISLASIDNNSLDQIYSKSRIKAFTYKWSDQYVNTYSVRSVLAVNTLNKQHDKLITQLLQDIKNHTEQLQTTGHPKWRMIDYNFNGIDWTIHPSAIEVFK